MDENEILDTMLKDDFTPLSRALGLVSDDEKEDEK